MGTRQKFGLNGFALILATVVTLAGCKVGTGSEGATLHKDNAETGLVVYMSESVPSNIQQVAKATPLPVQIIRDDNPAFGLVKAVLSSPTDSFFAVVNAGQNRYLNGGPIGKEVTLDQVKPVFLDIKRLNDAGQKQLDRLKPSKPGHVRLAVFSDYQCPFCKVMETTMTGWEKEFGDRLEVEFINFPLPMHQQAGPAAIAAECARMQGKFEPYQAALFENQSALSDGKYKALAKSVGLDTTKFNQCLTGTEARNIVNRDHAFGQFMGISGTPTLFINGKMLMDEPEQIRQAIEAELKKHH